MSGEKIKVLFNKYFSIALNILIFVLSTTGFILSCVFAKKDGYYHWLTRLLYFTQQSNLWIGITSIILAIFLIKKSASEKSIRIISVFKFIFTVSITITGIIFCSFLAPFADFDIWNFASVLTHVVVPIISIIDFFTNKNIVKLDKKHIWFTLIPPLIYFVFTSILCLLRVDFGRGDPYPYFFMDYYSEIGLFGFVAEWPPQIGSFYWFIFLFGLVLALGLLYYKIHTRIKGKTK